MHFKCINAYAYISIKMTIVGNSNNVSWLLNTCNNNNYSFYTHFGTSMRLQNTVMEVQIDKKKT